MSDRGGMARGGIHLHNAGIPGSLWRLHPKATPQHSAALGWAGLAPGRIRGVGESSRSAVTGLRLQRN